MPTAIQTMGILQWREYRIDDYFSIDLTSDACPCHEVEGCEV